MKTYGCRASTANRMLEQDVESEDNDFFSGHVSNPYDKIRGYTLTV